MSERSRRRRQKKERKRRQLRKAARLSRSPYRFANLDFTGVDVSIETAVPVASGFHGRMDTVGVFDEVTDMRTVPGARPWQGTINGMWDRTFHDYLTHHTMRNVTISFDIETLNRPEVTPNVAARYPRIARHDAANYDVFIIPDNHAIVRRFSCLVPINTPLDTICRTAQNLTAYVRLVATPEPDVYFNRATFMTDVRRLQRAEAMQQARELRRQEVGAHADRMILAYTHGSYNQPLLEPTAEQKASELLKQLDPTLHARMRAGTAFYFSTASHTYIWYPNERAIVSLEPEGPRYCCIHSRDHAVESNLYDWAITMRTYLLGNETYWRDTLNFHNEFRLRGGRGANPDIVREP